MSKPPITVKIYPNPNDGDFTVAFVAEKDVPVTLQVIGMDGWIFDTKNVDLKKGGNKIPYQLRKLASGTYVFGITCEDLKGFEYFRIQR